MIRFTLLLFWVLGMTTIAVAQEKFGPDDPFASINGQPVFVGELNLVLVDRLRVRDVGKAPANVQQAVAATLVRQHLAMLTLKKQGGASLQQLIDRKISDFARESQRVGSSLQQHAADRQSNERSLKANLAWQVAWNQYIKSRLTEKNLRMFFDRNRAKYAGGRWDVSQVFLEMNPRDETSIAIAQRRMADLVAQIRQSDAPDLAFAAEARQYSDAGSAAQGGKVGWVETDGDLPGSVMAVVRTTKPGSVSDPVRSPLGLHIVFVHDHQSSDLDYEDMTDQTQLRLDATSALFDHLVSQQKDAKISWYISALKPPAGVSLIPE
ncbi:MAG: hypothetical protein HKN47_28435 [Pirellulaceae bacterium]|nr:hypothetical protein [Pirellulaceae bacterium]